MDEIGDRICIKSSRLPRRAAEILYEDSSDDDGEVDWENVTANYVQEMCGFTKSF